MINERDLVASLGLEGSVSLAKSALERIQMLMAGEGLHVALASQLKMSAGWLLKYELPPLTDEMKEMVRRSMDPPEGGWWEAGLSNPFVQAVKAYREHHRYNDIFMSLFDAKTACDEYRALLGFKP